MPGPSETLPVLEQQLAERLLAFERLDEAWPRGRTAIERAELGRLDDRFRRDAGAVSMMVIPSTWMVISGAISAPSQASKALASNSFSMRWTDNSGASTAGAARALGVSHSATRA